MAAQSFDVVAREEVAAPVEFVFDSACRFGRFARQARAAGAKVQRREPDRNAGRGVGWDVRYPFRGTMRAFTIELVDRDRPQLLGFAVHSPAVEGRVTIAFTPLGAGRMALELRLSFVPRTLKARIMLQSARLARTTIESRICERLALAARTAEAEWQAGEGAR